MRAAATGHGGNRERRRRERTAAQLRREAGLLGEIAEQLEPLLGPAGRPTGAAAMSAWRRRQADAYLALPPWRRGWRTWVSWARPQRAAAAVALTGLWTLWCLPLQFLGLVGSGVSRAGVATLLALAPVAALAPPRPRGRFARALPPVGDRWRGSRASRRVAAAALALAVAGATAPAALVALGVGGGPTGLDAAAPALEAAAVREAVAATCGLTGGVAVEVLRPGRFRAVLPGGERVTVGMLRGRVEDRGGLRARLAGGAAACPAS